MQYSYVFTLSNKSFGSIEWMLFCLGALLGLLFSMILMTYPSMADALVGVIVLVSSRYLQTF